jgi:hypothetical protein
MIMSPVVCKMLKKTFLNVSIPISISLKGRRRGRGKEEASICTSYKMFTTLIYDTDINLYTSHHNLFWGKIIASNIIH